MASGSIAVRVLFIAFAAAFTSAYYQWIPLFDDECGIVPVDVKRVHSLRAYNPEKEDEFSAASVVDAVVDFAATWYTKASKTLSESEDATMSIGTFATAIDPGAALPETVNHAVFVVLRRWFMIEDFSLAMQLLLGGLAIVSLAAAAVPEKVACAPLVVLLTCVYLGFSRYTVFFNLAWDQLLSEVGTLAILAVPLLPAAAGRWSSVASLESISYAFRATAVKVIFMSSIHSLGAKDVAWASLNAYTYFLPSQPLPSPLAHFVAARVPATTQQLAVAVFFSITLWSSVLLALPLDVLSRVLQGMPLRAVLLPIFGTPGATWIACAIASFPTLVQRWLVVFHVCLQLFIAMTGHFGFYNLLIVGLLFAGWGPRLPAGHVDRKQFGGALVLFAVFSALVVAAFAVYRFGFEPFYTFQPDGSVQWAEGHGSGVGVLKYVYELALKPNSPHFGGVTVFSDIILISWLLYAAIDVVSAAVARRTWTVLRLSFTLPLVLLIVMGTMAHVRMCVREFRLKSSLFENDPDSPWSGMIPEPVRAAGLVQLRDMDRARTLSFFGSQSAVYGLIRNVVGRADRGAIKPKEVGVGRPSAEIAVKLPDALDKACGSPGFIPIEPRYKPSSVDRTPSVLAAPHTPRLDVYLNYLATADFSTPWLDKLVYRLLRTDIRELSGRDRGNPLRALLGPQPQFGPIFAKCLDAVNAVDDLFPVEVQVYKYKYRFSFSGQPVLPGSAERGRWWTRWDKSLFLTFNHTSSSREGWPEVPTCRWQRGRGGLKL